MKKCCGMYVVMSIAATLVGAVLCFLLPRYGFAIVGAAVFFLLWWTGYFFSIKYKLATDELIIQSGIIFRREKHIPFVNVLWTTRVSLGGGKALNIPLLTLIRTENSRFVIFSDYFTIGI